ncbi:PREDICTED: DNA repair-scaffolding protein-like [Branchiostoma belcheri]|uniref:DNA repair-scaffolding protein-like n=1 Tax=Branchiostoma belcheri TaxID=7741 RepID=A0A6P4ZI75_BRABE|nr:PREDICTED: DNA repair-scaffolding protein-like [Branchiostoma belcheri]
MFKKRKNPSSDKSFPSFESFHEGSHGKARPGGFRSAPSTKRLHKEWSKAGEGFAGFSLDPDTYDRAHSSRKRPRVGSQEQPGTSSQERNEDTFEDIPIEWSESEDEQEADSLSDIIPLSPVQSTSREEDNIISSSDQSDAGLPAQPRISQLASSTHQSQSESTPPISELSESTSPSVNASPRNSTSMARHTIPKVQGDSRSKQFSHLSRIPQSCAKVQSSVIQKLLLQKPKVTAEDVGISDYESASSDEADGGKAASPLEAATGSSVSISTPDPSPANPSAANKGTPKTGSDWLKKVQWQISSPKEGDNEEEPRGPLDSTRKGKKFVRGGLAEQLQRLQSRERASITFWNHKVANSTFDPSDQKTCLMVKVLSSCVECSVHITKCKTLSGHTLLGDAQSPYVSVLFNKQTAEQLGLEPGNTVAIYPPWQKLSIPGQNYPFLLCTYYCQTVTEGTIEGQENLEVEQREIRGPAPSLVTNLSPQKVQSVHSMLTSTRKSLRPSNLFPGTSSEGEASTAVDEDSAAGKNRLYPVRTGQDRQPPVRSFLEAIEGLAGRASAGLHVVATVQRVWCQSHQATLGQQALLLRAARSQTSAVEPTSEHRWHLLLEDGHGVFCELQVPNVLLQEEGWAACLHGGEGKEWVFSGLRVTHRANRGRMPTLFSLIDSVWSDSTARESWASQQDSEQSENTYVGIPTCLPPSFCYLVSARSGESRVEPSTDNLTGSLRDKSEKLEDSSVSPVYKSPQVVTLADSEETAADSARISLYVKLRFWRSQPSEDTSSTRETGHVLFVWDGSTTDSSQPYSKITVRQSCVIPEQVLDLMKQPGANLFLKDLLWERGRVLTADVCSVLHQACPEGVVTEWWQQVTPPDVWNSLTAAGTPGLQVITSSTILHSLVQVQGQVLSVDEDTAFSWPECDTCGNNKLIEQESSLQCPSCDKTVTEPLTRMSLEVYVDCPSLEKSGIVKIKLLQDSIQQLLSNQQADDEGYELQAVLGQELRSVDGYLASISRDPAGERVLMVEEIPQLQDVEMTAES